MGLFRVRGCLTGPTGRSENADLLVDTGATLLVVPRSLAERLELVARRSQPVLIAGGQRAPWPVAEVSLALSDGALMKHPVTGKTVEWAQCLGIILPTVPDLGE